MDEKTRLMVLFRETVADLLLGSEIDLSFPRSGLMFAIRFFNERYGTDVQEVCGYLDLAEDFAECISIYTKNSLFRFDREKKKFYTARPSRFVTPAIISGARQADRRHHRMLGNDY